MSLRTNAVVDEAIAAHDKQDALRVIEAATVLAALPGLMSPAARQLATERLRALAYDHPRAAEVFAAVVGHLESYA